MKPIVGEPTGDCYKCPFHRGMINKRNGVKIPGVGGKCVRPEGLCNRQVIDEKGFCRKCGCHVATHNDDGSCVDDKLEEKLRKEEPRQKEMPWTRR